MRTLLGLALSSVLLVLLAFEAHAGDWAGRVVDARTGEPIAGLELYGGARGRVDATEKALTAADGTFRCTYPPSWHQSILKDGTGFYLRTTFSQKQFPYLKQAWISPAPRTDVAMRLVPLNVWIKGRVVDDATGQPIADAEVSVMVQHRPDYDPLSAATLSYQTLSRAFVEAGIER